MRYFYVFTLFLHKPDFRPKLALF